MKTHRSRLLATLSLVGLLLLMGCSEADISSALDDEADALNITTAKASSAGTACVLPPSGMVNWWPGDGNAEDIVGSDHGTMLGATFASGKVDQAFRFDGVNDYVTFGSTAGNFGTADFTIDFWIQTTASGQWMGIIGRRWGCGNTNFWNVRMRTDGVILAELNDGWYDWRHYFAMYTQNTVNDGAFHHIAVVRQGTTGMVYIDGQPDVTLTKGGTTNLNNSVPLIAGRTSCYRYGERYFTGLIDEVEIFNRALSPEEIRAIYDAGSAGKCKTDVIEVAVDIKPGSATNPIHLGSEGNVPVAILTTASFDAATVDPLSVAFGPEGAAESHGRGHVKDVDADGDDDLLLHFRTQETGIAAGDTEACLTGATTSGEPVHGCDALVTVGR